MKKTIKFLKFIATGSFALILTACYGVMYGVPYKAVDGKVSVKNTEGEPIPGLKVSILDVENNYEVVSPKKTDSEGVVSYSINSTDMNPWYDYIVFVEDEDGLENNGYYVSESALIEMDSATGNFDTLIEVESLNLEGDFSIIDINGTVPADLEMDVFLVDGENETLISVIDDFYNYEVFPGDGKYIKIVNNSTNYQLNLDNDPQLEFAALAGNYSVVILESGPTPDLAPQTFCALGILDEFGKNLFLEGTIDVIKVMDLNQSDQLPVVQSFLGSPDISLPVYPSTPNSLYIVWEDINENEHTENFELFPGNQVITLK